MTQEAFTPTPLQEIVGTGPYTVSHGYDEGALVVAVVDGASRTLLDVEDYVIAPVSSETSGTVTLSETVANTNEGAKLEVTRSTEIEQGFTGQTTREKGLEAQLDWLVRAVQDNYRSLKSSVRTSTTNLNFLPEDRAGKFLYFDDMKQPQVAATTDAVIHGSLLDALKSNVFSTGNNVFKSADDVRLQWVVDFAGLDDLTTAQAPTDAIVSVGAGGAVLRGVTSGEDIETTGGAKLVVERGPEFNLRNVASATECAAYPDGTVCHMDGLVYEVDSSVTGTASCTDDLSVDGLIPHGFTATLRHYGVTGDGVTDDTDNFIRALNGALPVVEHTPMEILVTDSVPLKYGAYFIGAGGVAIYAKSRCRIKFAPTSPKKLFVWKTAPSGYVFEGATLKGFCISGNGANSTYCLDLPQCYNGDFDFFAYGNVQRWVRIERWMDTKLRGGVQGFSVCGVEASNVLGTGSGVTTTTEIDAYISQGPTAYLLNSFSFFGVKTKGTVESVDHVAVAEKANNAAFDIYMENVPRTDAGAAIQWGKSGTGDWYYSELRVNLKPGLGYNGGIPANTKFLDLGEVRQCVISGYLANTRSILSTTSDTRSVVFDNFSTVSVPRLAEVVGDIADMTVLNMTGLYSSDLVLPGDSHYSDFALAGADIELFPSDRSAILPRKLAVDKWTGKLVYRDDNENHSMPLNQLTTDVDTGWTFNGSKLVPGEMVLNSVTNTGQPVFWRSERHTKDNANSLGFSSTVSGSPVITRAGGFFPMEVDDWVTVSDGYGDATFQRRIIARASDYSTITLESDAVSTVSGTVTVATEAHQLVAIGQQGNREYGADPTGVLLPKQLGEEVFRSDTKDWYKSTGLTTSDWKAMT